MIRNLGIGFVLTVTSLVVARAAMAAPPTVMPSPGYDARLQEQHAAMQRAAESRHLRNRAMPAPHRHRHRHRH